MNEIGTCALLAAKMFMWIDDIQLNLDKYLISYVTVSEQIESHTLQINKFFMVTQTSYVDHIIGVLARFSEKETFPLVRNVDPSLNKM